MKHPAMAAATVVLAFFVFASPAHAAHVQCGDTLTTTTALDSDLACPGGDNSVALRIEADDVTLWMNGHTISNQAGNGVGIWAIPETGEYSNLHVRGGTLEGFAPAVVMAASDSSMQGLSTTGNGVQLHTNGSRNYAYRNVVEPAGVNTSIAIMMEGDAAYTWGNSVRGANLGIYSFGDRPRHVLNTVETCDANGQGLSVGAYTTGAVITRNVVSGCVIGIGSSAAPSATGGASVRLNSVTGNSLYGLLVADPFAIVGQNTADGNDDTGIHSSKAGTRIQNNTANNNGAYGINAAAGTVDGGGNHASGNGTQDCVNVSCTP